MKQPYIQEIFFILIPYFLNFIEKHKGGDGVNLTICEEDKEMKNVIMHVIYF